MFNFGGDKSKHSDIFCYFCNVVPSAFRIDFDEQVSRKKLTELCNVFGKQTQKDLSKTNDFFFCSWNFAMSFFKINKSQTTKSTQSQIHLLHHIYSIANNFFPFLLNRSFSILQSGKKVTVKPKFLLCVKKLVCSTVYCFTSRYVWQLIKCDDLQIIFFPVKTLLIFLSLSIPNDFRKKSKLFRSKRSTEN